MDLPISTQHHGLAPAAAASGHPAPALPAAALPAPALAAAEPAVRPAADSAEELFPAPVHTPDPRCWYGFALDRTLAQYHHWRGVDHIGEPIQPMVDKVKQYLAEGKKVKIFTARVWFDRVLSDTAHNRAANRPEVTQARQRRAEAHLARRVIQDWCQRMFGQRLEITCTKDPWCLELWDDIARQVERGMKGGPQHFFYACEPGIIPVEKVPAYAGLVHVVRHYKRNRANTVTHHVDEVLVIKDAPRLHKEPNEGIYERLCRSLMYKAFYKR